MRHAARSIIWLTLAILLAVGSPSPAFAQDGDPVDACAGGSVSGSVVAVDEATATVTIRQLDDSLCSVRLDSDYDHPITTLLGTSFSDANADSIEAALDALEISFDCPSGEDCALVAAGTGTSGQVISVTELDGGLFEIELQFTNDQGNLETATIAIDDQELAASFGEALTALQVDWELKVEDGDVFVSDAGDKIAALNNDGLGFGVIVKLYSMAEAAATACAEQQLDLKAEASDLCAVSLDHFVQAFQSGTGLGQLFQEYGKPEHLGVGHIRQETRGRANDNLPPDNACGYWRKHGPLGPDHPCYQAEQAEGQDNGGGKPPWAGSPGGPNNDRGKGKSD